MTEQIFVKTLAGKTLTIDITSESTVLDVKKKILETEGSSIEEQRLIFASVPMQDEQVLMSDYNVAKLTRSTIHLVLRLKGKPEQPS